MIAEPRPGGGERVSQAAIWRRTFQSESKGPKARACLMGSRNSKEASVSEKCVGAGEVSRPLYGPCLLLSVGWEPMETFGQSRNDMFGLIF